MTMASGSVAGLTASHNRGGSYFRARATPTNPSSPAQAVARGALTGLVNAWQSILTEVQRISWKVYADNVPTVDSLGQPLTLTGQQAYIRANTPRVVAGLGLVNDAPTVFDSGQAVIGIQDIVPGPPTTFQANFSASTGENGDMLIQVGPAQANSINYYAGPYRWVTKAAISSGITFTFATVTDAEQVFGTWVENARIPLRLRNTFDDGRLSAPWRGFLVIPGP